MNILRRVLVAGCVLTSLTLSDEINTLGPNAEDVDATAWKAESLSDYAGTYELVRSEGRRITILLDVTRGNEKPQISFIKIEKTDIAAPPSVEVMQDLAFDKTKSQFLRDGDDFPLKPITFSWNKNHKVEGMKFNDMVLTKTRIVKLCDEIEPDTGH